MSVLFILLNILVIIELIAVAEFRLLIWLGANGRPTWVTRTDKRAWKALKLTRVF
jgi:hypothetical protein